MIKEEYKELRDDEFIDIDIFEGKYAIFNNLYEINKLGEIRNKKSKKTLSPNSATGYLSVILYPGSRGPRKSIAVHILLAKIFLSCK